MGPNQIHNNILLLPVATIDANFEIVKTMFSATCHHLDEVGNDIGSHTLTTIILQIQGRILNAS